ncbi:MULTISPECIES: efflux RND transporter permease subunit [Acidobacterium]|uniref:Multidrug resistance protein MdtC n=1 Tax=Acidobacterium capsulatum (strain ATCC 51196 / DSM 11244 / BCRC 80197 / JCM 7670 / NBRC 15755 / NCIMB 13165 / 161) TaxID=240015 RepID=C1F6B2_ACIC5|nr:MULTISPECIES: efflux RND transporter permease subunit [Acidobacterium]ACO32323.1 multidrug resistance protein MdtC [Acidobacterium capsulatum ATCC 51196]HCT60702.1 multidrug transporter subunit MdtC [Acidobacterium sp.]
MNPCAPFIRRPVATTLLTLAVAIAGAVGYSVLPVAPLPQVDFPTINVNASLPGASAETMATSVATPLERQFGQISGVTEMTSSSSLGSASITLQFDLNRDINGAANDVQAAINAARTYLPANLPSNPNYFKENPADSPILIMSLTSKKYDTTYMYDKASTIFQQKLSQINGVGQVFIGGASSPSVRVEVNPTQLESYGLTLPDLQAALSTQNADLPRGQIANSSMTADVITNDQISKAAQYQPLIVGYHNGAAVRLDQVARVYDGSQNVRTAGYTDGVPSVTVIIFRQPGANVIQTVDRIKAQLPALEADIPTGIDVHIVHDRTVTIRASVKDVELTLLVALVLVVLVVFIFLRSPRATLIPSVAVPVSIIGTFAVMYLLGFSLDNLSLMALTISTGFVVDDAIVVMENITRHVENGMTPMAAALKGAGEIGFTVFSISMSLIAVFIPILLMGGIIGRLFREFAVTLATAIVVSMVVSLTTTPTMCAHLLKGHEPEKQNRFSRASEKVFDSLLWGYRKSLEWALENPVLILIILGLTIALNFVLIARIPKGFFPEQDTGFLIGGVMGPQDASFPYMNHSLLQIVKVIQADPAVEYVNAYTGGRGSTNNGFVFASLKPLSVRKISATGVINRLRPKLNKLTGAAIFLQSAQDLRIGGRSSNAQYQYTIQSDNEADLLHWGTIIKQHMSRLPGFADVNSDQQDGGLAKQLDYNRMTAARLGQTSQSLDSAVYSAFGQSEVSVIHSPLNQYYVVLEVAPKYWQSPEGLNSIYLKTGSSGSNASSMTPLSQFARFETTTTPLQINHTGQFPSVTISFNLQPGVSLSTATSEIDRMEEQIGLPGTVRGTFSGTLQAFQKSLSTEPMLIITAILAVYIVLGVLYESLMHPLTILSTLPSASVGAMLALMLFHKNLDVISIIGIILLIGIVKKNAIMMIDFALMVERNEGKSPHDSIFEACMLRFRPIMMTTTAALGGALPLAFGTGIGAELRRPLGITIVGGLMLSQIITLYTTPVVYLTLDRLRLRLQGKQRDTFHPGEQAAH